MAELDDLLKSINVGDIASKLGVDEATAEATIQQAVPTLLHGLHAQEQTPGPAPEELTKAADAGDGEGLVNGLFGKKTDKVAEAAAKHGPANVQPDLIKKVLPMLAPIVIAYVTQKFLGGQGGQQQAGGQPVPGQQPPSAGDPSAQQQPQAAPAGGAGGALGQILGGALGGGGAGGGLGNILGSVLGGGQQGGGAGGALGNVLGSILGGKK
ncbi:MAG: DUF937 domain-containing protein [Gordonia sp. (in: high G+C Gram-positive bacteria)]|uniref:DUF937 domain-containing protein n=1 Tax=Gordonia sp. (in: high G+C Gram-positive bacteria) TaxID=84139 RepID=UPI0039E46338